MEPVEIIVDGNITLAYIVRAGWQPEKTQFITPETCGQQLGLIVYAKGEAITPHRHHPVTRSVRGTTECLLVRNGLCEVDLYDREGRQLTSRRLGQGDVILLLDGGHGFRMLEDTVLLEIKQGPYLGADDKERF